jgi:hemoglobin
MKNAHAGLSIKSNQFEAMVEDLKITFRKFKISQAEQNSLLAILGPMKKDVVEE